MFERKTSDLTPFLILAFSFLFLTPHLARADLVINELTGNNSTTIADEDGDYEDWVELYNRGDVAVNLGGYGLTDDPANPFQWVFPDWVLGPGEHLLVWTSGKDRRPAPGERLTGIVREVYHGLPTRLVSVLLDHFTYPNQPDIRKLVTDYFEAPRDIDDHYGTRMRGYIVPPQTGEYTFWIASDDAGRLYLDPPGSTSVADYGSPIAYIPDDQWSSWRQWDKFSQQQSDPIVLEAGEKYLITALQKEHEGGDHLTVRWRLPDGTMEEPIPAHRILTEELRLHANFSISKDGNPVQLTAPDGTVVDAAPPVQLPPDVSFGRIEDGAGEWVYFENSTPGTSNNEATGYAGILDPPEFSHAGGFYTSSFALTLSAGDPDVTIYYTRDSSRPDPGHVGGHTRESMAYEDAVSIETTVVLRARTFKEGYLPSATVTQTFIVDPNVASRYDMPVISIAAEQPDLFGDLGIYVPGWSAQVGGPANFLLKGIAWERPAHVTFFEPNGEVGFAQDAGIRIHGGWTRNLPQKSLRLYARGSLYGESEFGHEVYPDAPYESYNRLLLRNSGNDNQQTMFRDAMMQRLVEHMRMDTQAYRPSVVYLNGQYWGIQNIRERYDKHYLARTYGVDPENVDILEFRPSSPHAVKEGDDDHYSETVAYIESNGLSNPAHYEYIRTRIDIDNFIDYNVAQIFVNNSDWPNNNNDFWRLRAGEYDSYAPHGHDGRWRWLLFDTDFGFGHSRSASYNLLEAVTQTSNDWWRGSASTFLLRELLENQEFRNEFINRFADMLNTAFLPDRVVGVINEMQSDLVNEMTYHTQRWGTPGNWNGHVNTMRNFANDRPGYVWGHLRGKFNLTQSTLTLGVSDSKAGSIRVNTIDVDSGTPGIGSSAYPWTGSYFNEVPLNISAQPRPGFRFSHWEELDGEDKNSRVLNFDLAGNTTLTAVFEETESPISVHYWHFNELPVGIVSEVVADYSVTGEARITYPGTGEGYMDDTEGSDLNARFSAPAGSGLRVRNPSDTRTLQFDMPTTGYEQLRFSYAVHRTPNGARGQAMEYRTETGSGNWVPLEHQAVNITEDYRVLEFDFSDIPEANDNSEFAVRLRFTGIEASGVSGNNRFDNVALDGVPMEGTEPPSATTLAFESAPAAVQVGRDTFPFTVAALLETGAVDAAFAGEVTLSVESGPGELSGTVTTTIQGGRGTFGAVRFSDPGMYLLSVAGGGISSEEGVSVQAVLLKEEIMPLYMQGDQDAIGDNLDRIPFAFRLSIEGLTPETTYRYGNRVVISDDPLNQNGAGNAILITGNDSDWVRNTDSPRFQEVDYGSRHLTFTTDANGRYAGWFVTEPSGNARFTPGGTVFIRLLLNDGEDGEDLHHFLTTEMPITILPFGTGPGEGSGFMGEAASGNRSFVVFYDSEDGVDRPLAAVPVEITGSETDNRYADFYHQIVAATQGHWGAILPNELGQGVRRIEERSLENGALLKVYRAPDGIPGTIDPDHGLEAYSLVVDYANTSFSYSDWRQMVFTDPADLADPEISGPAADPGGLGVENLLRFAFDLGSGPVVRAGLPRLEIDSNGEAILIFAYPVNRTGIAYLVRASTDQVDWRRSIFDSRLGNPEPDQDGKLRVGTGYTPGEDPDQFFRVRILLLD